MRNCQAGRSMMEMLGVLSIIGMLSVGGIAGYSKMMQQYKINTAMQQINLMASKLSALGSQTNSYGGLDNAAAIKFDAVPSEAVSGDSKLTNPFGGNIVISSSSLLKDSADTLAYTITYYGLPHEACLNLISRNWHNSKSSSLLGVGVGADAAKNIYQGSNATLPIDISTARGMCNCGENCTLVFKFF